jgi:citronellol/citronellal dehydrogenase
MPVPVPLKGKTIVITGASRGIGRAIAHRCARDGANIAILAKTAEPHPKLPGTIYTTAKEVEELGGKALPITCDIRFEDQVKKAIDLVVKTFGGIDVLVNNASALGLLPTEDLPLKTYDLVNTINARGTFLCSKYCIPHLAKSTNPHGEKNTMAKYGMSLCVLGMSHELQDKHIAVNALWPRAPVATSALTLIIGAPNGDDIGALANSCTEEIMSDAAWEILTSPSTTCTGNFFIDDDLVRDKVATLEKYSILPGEKHFYDFFVSDEDDKELVRLKEIESSKEYTKTRTKTTKSIDSIKIIKVYGLIQVQRWDWFCCLFYF